MTQRICSPCLRGTHKRCTNPETCACVTCHMPEGFAWEDPPPRSRRGGGHRWGVAAGVLKELRRNPKRWARVQNYRSKTSARTRAQAIAKGKTTLDLADWEAEGRVLPGGGSALYLRFIGSP